MRFMTTRCGCVTVALNTLTRSKVAAVDRLYPCPCMESKVVALMGWTLSEWRRFSCSGYGSAATMDTPEGNGRRRDRTLLDIKVDLRLMKLPVLDWAWSTLTHKIYFLLGYNCIVPLKVNRRFGESRRHEHVLVSVVTVVRVIHSHLLIPLSCFLND
jgi:hypothetical protein